jgi:succinoglycan biosynthesis protein ExoW
VRFATIIPYYQTKPGLLSRAVESALSQPVDNTVIVVCDNSPHPAERDLNSAGLLGHSHVILRSLAKNVGAAGARNVGIDIAESFADAIAFLDSDDYWSSAHLQRASRAISFGQDFYFSDHKREDWPASKFRMRNLQPQGYSVVSPQAEFLVFPNGQFPVAQLSGHLVQTSTVVVRANALVGLRFALRLSLFEDDYLWIQLAQRGVNICFSTQLGALLGSGVNISVVDSWGDARAFQKSLHLMEAWQRAFEFIEEDPGISQLQHEKLRSLYADLGRQLVKGDMRPIERLHSFALMLARIRWGMFLQLRVGVAST